MNQNEIAIWLQRKRRSGMGSAALYAIATLIGGTFVLGLTFCFVFVVAQVARLSLFPPFPFGTAVSALLAFVVTGLIFADSIHARRDDMSFLPAWLLREYISIGPRLIIEGWPHLTRARRFAQLDLELCESVLTYLAGKSVPTSREELRRARPEVEWSRLIDQLRLLEGVIFFQPGELRVILTLPLRLELRGLLGRTQSTGIPEAEPEPEPEPESEPQTVPVDEPHKLSPSEILGIPPTATFAQIQRAYRSRIKECHPDRFASTDEHSRSLAEEWTKSLNGAYEFLKTQAREQNPT